MKTISSFFIILTCQLFGYAQVSTELLTIELQKLMEQNSLEGCAVAIYNKDEVLYTNAFGYADRKKKIPYTVNTAQKIASISKTLLATALMKAKGLGLLDLDDDVNDYLPFRLVNPYFPNTKITIRHLATHSSGMKKSKYDLRAMVFPTKIPDLYKDLPFGIKRFLAKKGIKILNNNPQMPMKEFLFNIYDPKGKWYKKRKTFAKSKPGTQQIYSNNGAALAALIIEKASGMKYNEFVHKYILDPLKMKNTHFDFEIENPSSKDFATLHHMGLEVPNDYQLIIYPAGGLVTNVLDFSKYMSTMVNGYKGGNQILSSADYQEMMRPQINPDFNRGIFWEVYQKSIGHSGDIAGVVTYTYFDKAKGMGYIFFCNTAATKKIDQETLAIIDLLKKYYNKM
ncbi:MAG TPA: class A beta-lactamase-related serine hydrolase [Bacteroidetes bacterium]|nr:class A beta-lactamase-related serine hydrolase [Bacteroidota bacterium]